MKFGQELRPGIAEDDAHAAEHHGIYLAPPKPNAATAEMVKSFRPTDCRNRLKDEGKAYPKSGCHACRNGGLAGCPYENFRAFQTPTSEDWFVVRVDGTLQVVTLVLDDLVAPAPPSFAPISFERQGMAYNSAAAGHELQGRDTAPAGAVVTDEMVERACIAAWWCAVQNSGIPEADMPANAEEAWTDDSGEKPEESRAQMRKEMRLALEAAIYPPARTDRGVP